MLASQEIENLKTEELTQFPTISIVIPNYNGGKTIGAAIESLIAQNYPNLEIIVIDGGSTDNSFEVIKQFESYLAWWVSEKDYGQSNAINKGLANCSGEIVNWLCSDDFIKPGALHKVAKYFIELPDIDVLVARGEIVFTGENLDKSNGKVNFWLNLLGKILGLGNRSIIQNKQSKQTYIKAPTLKQISLISVQNPIAQPSCFFRRSLLNRPKPIDETYNYAMDTELWNYFQCQNANWKCIDDVLSVSIQDGQNKTSTGGYKITLELERIYNTYVKEIIPLTFWHRRLRYPLERCMALYDNQILLYIVGLVWIVLTFILALFYGLDKVWALRWKRWI